MSPLFHVVFLAAVLAIALPIYLLSTQRSRDRWSKEMLGAIIIGLLALALFGSAASFP